MAFFALLWKARTIEKYRINYESEKINSILTGHKNVEQTLSQRWRHYRNNTQKLITRAFHRWHPETTSLGKFLIYLNTDQTFPNFLIKSVMGFVGGIILTYLCFMFFVFQLSISIIHATIMSSIIGVLLTLGLAFSYRISIRIASFLAQIGDAVEMMLPLAIRCVIGFCTTLAISYTGKKTLYCRSKMPIKICLVFLLIPQFFSRVGRYTLTCYALVLILTGPATNTLKNSEVLSESMACSQEQIKTSVHQLNDMMKKPYNTMSEFLKPIIDRLKTITEKVKQMVVILDRLVLSIVSVVQSSFAWLQSIADICNARLGTPYERCLKMLSHGYDDCKKSLNSEQDVYKFCTVDYMVDVACHTVKPFKAFCYVSDFMDESILASVKKNLGQFNEHLRAMFHVEVHIHHSYSYNSNSSRTAGQIAAGIVTEIRNRADPLLTWLSWSSCVTSLFLLLIIFRAKYYQHMYETRSRFDNRYVTKELQDLDLKRQRQGRSTVLPLNRRETAKYITTRSFRLVASEKVYLNRSVVFMAITTFKLLIHMVADYSLYWVLMTIRHHGQYQSDLMPGTPHSGVFISGRGFIARLFRSIVNTLDIPLAAPSPSPTPCLPDPYPPDLRRYTQIGVLIFLLWFFALFEPYGLRLRHLIMGHYRPERARARATWLYNHILRTRAGFMKFARRKLHREYKYSAKAPPTLRQWLDDHLPCRCLKSILGISPDDIQCLLCGITPKAGDPDSRLTKCQTPHCPGTYCISCFADIGQLCTICLTPEDYGDLSDVSLEKGSDDNDSDQEGPLRVIQSSASRANLLQNERSNDSTRNDDSSRRWKYFSKSTNKHCEEDAVDLIPSSNIETLEVVIQYFVSGLKKFKCIRARNRIKNSFTSKWIANLPPENIYEDFSAEAYFEYYTKLHDFDEGSEFNESFNMTKSIGINTDKNRGFIVNALLNMVRRRRVKRSRVFNKSKNKTIIDKIKDRLSSDSSQTKRSNQIKNYKAHDLKIVQRNLKRIMRNKQNTSEQKVRNKILVYREIKGVVNAIRYVMRSNEQVPVNNHSKELVSSNPPTENPDKVTKSPDETNQDGIQNKKSSKFNKAKTAGKKAGVNKTKTKNSRHRLSEFHTFFSKHWNSIKFSIIPCACAEPPLVSPKDKKNHKRRKKRKAGTNLDGGKAEESSVKKDNKQTRNIRLSAFLAELEWNKREYKNEQGDGPENTTQFFTDGAPPQPTARNKIIGMVQLKNLPFQWREVSKVELCKCRDKKCTCQKYKNYEKYINQSQQKPATQNPLDRLRLKVTKVTEKSPTTYVKKIWSKINVGFEKQPFRNDTSICISKRESYFRSCTNFDNTDEATRIQTDTLFRNEKFFDDVHISANSDESDSETSSSSFSSHPSSFMGHAQRELVISRSSIFAPLSSKKKKKSKFRNRCRCDIYEDIQKKWAYVKNRFCKSDPQSKDKQSGEKSRLRPSIATEALGNKTGGTQSAGKWGEPAPQSDKSQSLSKAKAYLACLSGITNKLVDIKDFASSLFGPSCTVETCPNKLEKMQKEKEEKAKEQAREKAREKARLKAEKKRSKKHQTGTQTTGKNKKKKTASQTQDLKDSELQVETDQTKSTDTKSLGSKRKIIVPSKNATRKRTKHIPKVRLKSKEHVVTKEESVATVGGGESFKKPKLVYGAKTSGESGLSKTSEETNPKTGAKVHIQSKGDQIKDPRKVKGNDEGKHELKAVGVGKEKDEGKAKEVKGKGDEGKAKERRAQEDKPKTTDKGVDVCKKERDMLKKCEATHSGTLVRTTKTGNFKELRSAVVSSTSPHRSPIVNLSLENVKSLDQRKEKSLRSTMTPFSKSRASSPIEEILKGETKGFIGFSTNKPTKKESVKEIFRSPNIDERSAKEEHNISSIESSESPSREVRKSPAPLIKAGKSENKKSTKIFVTTKASAICPEDFIKQALKESRGINVAPEKASGACQANFCPVSKFRNRSVQYETPFKSFVHDKCNCDVNVGTGYTSVCTCATQHISVVSKANVGTVASPTPDAAYVLNQCRTQDTGNKKSNIKYNKRKICFGTNVSQRDGNESSHNRSSHYTPRRHTHKRQRESKADNAKRRQSLSLEKSMCVLKRVAELARNPDATRSPSESVHDSTMSESTDSSISTLSLLSDDETKTDTTICSLATVNYDERPRRRRYRPKVVTKMNQSTSTDKARLCDTGTITSDWWSPLVERKVHKTMQEKNKVLFERQRKEFELRTRKKSFGVTADGRIVTFRSKTQIIPPSVFGGNHDILSPSRYLLESQKYYNELFAYNCRRVSPKENGANMPKFQEREKTPRSTRRNHYRKTKRLDECYSPKRQTTPRKRCADSTHSKTDSPRRRSQRYRTRQYPKSPRKKGFV